MDKDATNDKVCMTHPEIGGYDGGEDLGHGVLAERVHGDDVEVSQEARRHGVAAATRGPHGAQELDVQQKNPAGVLQVIPAWKTRPSVGTLRGEEHATAG